jgi:hypothetical protein
MHDGRYNGKCEHKGGWVLYQKFVDTGHVKHAPARRSRW